MLVKNKTLQREATFIKKKAMSYNVLVKIYTFLLLTDLILASGEICKNKNCSKRKLPLLDNVKAPLIAEIDVSQMNIELQEYIDAGITEKSNQATSDQMSKIKTAMEKMKLDVKNVASSEASRVFTKLRDDLNKLTTEVNKQENRGTTYVRWGKSNCTGDGVNLVYNGFIGGSVYTAGGAPNKLCLPETPQFDIQDDKTNNMAVIGATVIDNYVIDIPNTLFDKKHNQYMFHCAVCLSTKSSMVLMIPARTTCYGEWKKEYSGYLFAGYFSHKAASEYICVDRDPDFTKKTPSWTGKSVLYSVSVNCNGATPCPPYVEGAEMTCVVCSK